MRIIEDDGSYITFEHFEPKWPLVEVIQRHHNRAATELAAAGAPSDEDDWVEDELDPKVSGARGTYLRLKPEFIRKNWHLLDKAANDRITQENCGDHREAMGLRRHDAKPIQTTTQRRPYEWLADRYGIPTNGQADGPWRRLVREAVEADETKGKIGDED